MLLNNLSIYQDVLKKSKADVLQREDKRYEVERLYSTSPIIFDYSETYLPEDSYMIEDEEVQKTGEGKENEQKQDKKEDRKLLQPKESVLTFSPEPIRKVSDNDPSRVSALGRMIEEFIIKEQEAGEAGKDGGGVPLTIYLPDCNSITVKVKETYNFSEVILAILRAHEKQGIEPPLVYDDPGMYELRIHEGDGEPDRDFPALGAEKLLSDFNLDEYCICAVEGRRRTATGPTSTRSAGVTAASDNSSNPSAGRSGASGMTLTGGIKPSSTGVSQFSSGMPSGMSGMTLVNGGGRLRDETVESMQSARDRFRSASKLSYDSSIDNTMNVRSTVLVVFPDSTQVVVPFHDETRLLDLLPFLSRHKRLRLYTNEYVFSVSPADQKRLKLMYPQLDMDQVVSTLGATTLEIHNKVYQDVSKVDKATSNTKKKKAVKKTNKSNFTEAMANAYQEWNVVKKNKFGRKQERVFGVDGKKIYNSKRGQLRGGQQSGVQRAERNISTIVKLDILSSDPKTFRITWMDDRDVYNIEYTCETARECAEIVAKINYTREKSK